MREEILSAERGKLAKDVVDKEERGLAGARHDEAGVWGRWGQGGEVAQVNGVEAAAEEVEGAAALRGGAEGDFQVVVRKPRCPGDAEVVGRTALWHGIEGETARRGSAPSMRLVAEVEMGAFDMG